MAASCLCLSLYQHASSFFVLPSSTLRVSSFCRQGLERQHQEKLKMQAEIKRINDENQKQKAERMAQEKLADQMVMEFTKKKMVGSCCLMLGPMPRSDMSITDLSNNGTLAEDSHVFVLKYIGLASFSLYHGQITCSIRMCGSLQRHTPRTTSIPLFS